MTNTHQGETCQVSMTDGGECQERESRFRVLCNQTIITYQQIEQCLENRP